MKAVLWLSIAKELEVRQILVVRQVPAPIAEEGWARRQTGSLRFHEGRTNEETPPEARP